MAGRVLVVGFGSGLVADDGIGPAVIRRLEALGPVPGVRVEHGGQDSLRLIGLWRGEPEVWLVDAIVRGAPPGTVHCLGHEELLAIPQQHGTAHQLSLPESLRWLALSYPDMAAVRYRLWGVEPERLELGVGLSPAVARAVDAVADEVRRAAGR
ncbi:MAG TPA: hydrogenase maturation protease [Vicinamibacteria bacterium]|nr:hydrogenase maturation protease [Vicinamibacteria bacterium]